MHSVHVGDGLKIGGCPAVSWSAMWEMLDSRATGYRETTAEEGARHAAAASAPVAAAQAAASTSTAPLRRELRGNALRQALSTAVRTSDMNVVSHPGQSDADIRRLRLREDAE
eukprot:3612410-Pleurochrysis_carterae.AAC.1